MFPKPGAPVDKPLKYRIDKLYEAKQPHKPCLYQMGEEGFMEVKH